MYFDGSIAPKRVVSLSGASAFGRTNTLGRSQPGFLRLQQEQDRACRTIVPFLRHVVDVKRAVLRWRELLPQLLARSTEYVDKISLPPANYWNDRQSKLCDNGQFVWGDGANFGGGAGISLELHGESGGVPQPGCATADSVTYHPVCQLMRAVAALARVDWRNDYSHYVRLCLAHFRRWYFSDQHDDATRAMISDRAQLAQLVRLFLNFFRILFRSKKRNLANSGAHASPANSAAYGTAYTSFGTGQGAIATQRGPPYAQGFGLASLGRSGTTGYAYGTLGKPSGLFSHGSFRSGVDSRTWTYKAEEDDFDLNLTLNNSIDDMEVVTARLSFDEAEIVHFVSALFRLVSRSQAQELNDEFGIATEWYPAMVGRALANLEYDSHALLALLEIATPLRDLCTTKESALRMFVNVWVVPNLVKTNYDVKLLRCAFNATFNSAFLQGLCFIGCQVKDDQPYGATSNTRNTVPVGTGSPDRVTTIVRNLTRMAGTKSRKAVSLHHDKCKAFEQNLRMQVESFLGASDLMMLIRKVKLDSGTHDSSLMERIEKSVNSQYARDSGVPENVEPFPYVRLGSPHSAGPSLLAHTDSSQNPTFTNGFAGHSIFTNLCNLLKLLSDRKHGYHDKDTIASILSVTLFCAQLLPVPELEAAGLWKFDSTEVFAHLLHTYRKDTYIVMAITLLLVPVVKWDYFVTDPDAVAIANAARAADSIANPPVDDFDHDSYRSVWERATKLLFTWEIMKTMLTQFKRHHANCCGGSFNQFGMIATPELSNDGALCCLWRAFATVLEHCMLVMNDTELVGDDDEPGLFDADDVAFLVAALNHTSWYHTPYSHVTEEMGNYGRCLNFPENSVCSCGIEVKVNALFHHTKGHGSFTAEYWGKLAYNFNLRFLRQSDGSHSPSVITEVDRLVLNKVRTKQFKAPILKFVHCIPQTVTFETRLQLFMAYVAYDKSMNRANVNISESVMYIIRRSHIVEDGLSTLGTMGSTLLKQIFRVIFVDETGVREEGVDGGGLFKEFLTSICSIIFNPAYGIFEESQFDGSMAPSPNSAMFHEGHLSVFNFVGKVIGKALYEHILIEPVLSRLLLNFILKKRNTLNDLRFVDPELYRNLVRMRKMTSQEIESMGLTFTTTISSLGNSSPVEIMKGGSDMVVTKENLNLFLFMLADFKCNTMIEKQSSAFLQGISSVIPLDWLRMFSYSELVYLMSGSSEAINLADMRANTTYSAGYTETSEVIVWFWEIMDEFDDDQRRMFLWFVTCCKRGPLMGFGQLQPPFCITRDRNTDNLPTASTCINLLKLPEYESKEVLRAKLLDAMTMSKGFGFA
ncbi:HECT domain containing protein, putative [Babesia bigemina]|uniref:HECT-type E3 ubiquitin transferase n=1 Tax=Babesia bigemina TaxID=5866 RepID=A0A061CZ92_BABBI|nr:HECT domain containing protein, putative [Babesia bigemina]CDR93748.1 HECT domain containing protein, putative [Babesia bigemina]|eukprot:XP_012765934.1 HECT domain containing protein, putative [Babesia bigemina]